MDENEKKENTEPQTDEASKTDANEAPKTDEAKEASKTDVNEQPKKEKAVVTAKDKFAIAFLIALPFCIIITIAVNRDNDTDTSTSSSYSSDYDTSSYSSDYDTDEDYDTSSSSDDDTSTVDDSDWDYSALENDPSNYISIDDYDYESQNCYDQALDYLNLIGYSRNGLIKQLQSDGYTDQAISNALYVLEKGEYVTWKSQAVKKAQQYMNTFSFSQQRLYEQLISDGFTQEEANYGVSYVFNNN